MIKEVFGKKIGMTQLFDEEGNVFAATLIEIEPVCVLEKVSYPTKSKAKIGCFEIKGNREKKVKKPVMGYFKKIGVSPYRLIREVDIEDGADFSFQGTGDVKEEIPEPIKDTQKETPRKEDINADSSSGADSVPKEESKDDKASGAGDAQAEKDSKNEEESPGNQKEKQTETKKSRFVGVEIFSEGEIVVIKSKTKGKGFTGGMKRHGWSGQPGSHGSTMHRRPGSVGASAYPSRILKGSNMPGHMGNAYRSVKNLQILKIDKEKDLIFIRGSIPGSRGTIVGVRKSN